MDPNPFPNLHVKDSSFLENLEGRSICPLCKKSRKYFCYSCYVPVHGLEGKFPKVVLPISVDIIKHPSECDSKSTSIHAKLLAPDHVNIYTYPCIPDYEDKQKVILVFPGDGSILMEELAATVQKSNSSRHNKARVKLAHGTTAIKQDQNECSDAASDTKLSTTNNDICYHSGGDKSLYFEHVVFVDGTWNHTHKILSDERLKDIRRIQLKDEETKFWRHQTHFPNTYLATIEAIYYFLLEYHKLFIDDRYTGEYDDLLFLFIFMYQKIRNLQKGGSHLRVVKEKLLKTQ